jgi:hypothetical protein
MTHTHEKALERLVACYWRPVRRGVGPSTGSWEGHGVVITRHDWRTNGDLLE